MYDLASDPLPLALGIPLGIIGSIVLIFLLRLYFNNRRNQRVSEDVSFLKSAVNQLVGMAREQKQIDLNVASKILDKKVIEVKSLLYSLIGENKVEGRFEQDVFIPTSNLEDFIKSIENLFAQAQASEAGQAGKSKKV